MYYLRKEPYETTTPDGRQFEVERRAIYKHHDFARFYRGEFTSIDNKYQGMKLYTCKTLKRILELRKDTFDYCGEWFDVYDENGVVHGEWENEANSVMR